MNSKTLKAFAGVALLLIVSVGVAMWSETLRVNVAVATGEVDWEFVRGSLIWLDACGLGPGYGNDWNASYLPEPGADQLDKDVGCTSVTFIDSDGDGDYDTMEVTLYNVYPWYYTHIAFKVHNDGSVPIKIWRIVIDDQEFYEIGEGEGLYLDLTGDGKPDILMWWGDNFGVQLHPCKSADISLDITVLQDAPQGSTLTFTISFEAIQWNEYSTPTTTTIT